MESENNRLKNICNLVAEENAELAFSILEIGALPIEGEAESFYQLIDFFPNSSIIAFEVDEDLCSDLNTNSKEQLHYFPVALGLNNEEVPFYETQHPMCSSLYPPNWELMRHYNNLEVASLKSKSSIKTQSLDFFLKENNINDVDFIKIDIQGAELSVFQGGENILEKTIFIVSEVEFIPLYEQQPLFGEVCKYLASKNLMFHKFLGLAGRTLKPLIINNNPNIPTQHMWSDAVFIKEIKQLPSLSANKLLKMAILAFSYGSPDVTYHCFQLYDAQYQRNLSKEYIRLLS